MNDLLYIATLLTTVGCGMMGGLFFGFSTSVMKALGRRPPAEGMSAMQAINVVILNPLFLSVFLGTAVGCVIVLVDAVLRWPTSGSVYLLAGSLLYLVGTFGVTAACNVSRNDALAAAEPTSPDGVRLWAAYLSEWTAWNHVRTIAAVLAAALLILGLRACN